MSEAHKNLQQRQKNFTSISRANSTILKRVSEKAGENEITVKGYSIYSNDQPMNASELAIQSVRIKEIFNMPAPKAKIMMEIIAKEKWSKRKLNDAIEHVIKTNIYNTGNVGIEPAKILSYDRVVKLFTQEQVMEFNGGTGTHGFSLVKTPFLHTVYNGNQTNLWYVKDSDIDLVPNYWHELDRVLVES